jgi:GTPases
VGKSTLMNLLAKSDVFVGEQALRHAGHDRPQGRHRELPVPAVGHRRFHPETAHAAGGSLQETLDEVREADILVHVVDISHPEFEEQMQVVEQTLRDIGAANKPVYVVFNKVDAYTYEPYDEFSLTPKEAKNRTLDELKNSWIAQEKTPCIFISAKEKIGIEKLRNDLYKMVAEIHAGRYPFNNFLW